MRERKYDDFVSIRPRPQAEWREQASHEDPELDPVKAAIGELKRRIRELREAKEREEEKLRELRDKLKRLKKVMELGEDLLKPGILRRLEEKRQRLEHEVELAETHILIMDDLIHILLAIDLWLDKEVLPSKGKLAALRRILKQLGPLPTLVRIIMAILSMAGLPTPSFVPVVRV